MSATLRAISSSGQNGNWLVVVGLGGTVIRSTNAGLGWCILDPDVTTDFYAVEAPLNSEYLVGGAGGVLLRTTNGGGSCIDPTGVASSSLDGAGFRLTGPVPNPMRGQGTAQFEVPRSRTVRAEVFDAAGRRVATLFEGRVEAGSMHQLQMNAGQWPSGSYFLRLSGANASITRRIVVVR